MRIWSFVAGPENTDTVGGIAYIDRLTRSILQYQPDNQVELFVCGLSPVVDVEISEQELAPTSANGFPGFQIHSFAAKGKYGFSLNFLWVIPRLFNTQVDFIRLHSVYTFPVVVGYILARIKKVPYVIWPHGVFSPYQRSISRIQKNLFDHFFTHQIFRNASAVVFTARDERQEFRALRLPVRSVVIPHGIDLKKYEHLRSTGEFRAHYFGAYAGPIILFLSRINSKKGLDLLVPALQALQAKNLDFRVAIVGAGDPPAYETQLKEWLATAQLGERVVLTGPLYGAEKLMAFADSDLFVLPSRSENFGYAVFEALAAKLPVVISKFVNLASEIEAHQAGLCIDLNVTELTCSLEQLLMDETLRQRLAENGYRFASTYSWENNGRKIHQMVTSILNQTPFPAELDPEVL